MRNSVVLAVCLLASAASAYAQSRASLWREYRVADGLAEDACASVSVGPHGTVWVSHPKAGLISELDGYSVTHIPSPGPFFGRVYESPAHQLWVVTSSGLSEFRDDKWTAYPVPDISAALLSAGSNNLAIPLYPVRTGRVLFLLPEALMQFDFATGISPLLAVTNTPLERFSDMIAGPRDHLLWLAGLHGLVHSLNQAAGVHPESGWTNFMPPSSLNVRNLTRPVQDADGGITCLAENSITNQKDVLRFDGQNWAAQSAGDLNVQFACRGPDGSQWVATVDSLFQVEGQDASLNEESMPRHRYVDLASDPTGTFWLATSDGLFRYSPPAWRPPSGLDTPDAPVNAMTRDHDGRLWLASVESLSSYSSNRWRHFSYPANQRPDFAAGRSIFALADDSIVLPAENRLIQFIPHTTGFRTIEPPAGKRLRIAGQMSDGTLALEVTSLEPTNEPPTLLIFDGTSKTPFPYPAPARDIGHDLLLASAPDGSLWLAGSTGLLHLQDQKWQTINLPDDRDAASFIAITEDTLGHLWGATRQKVWNYDLKSWTAVLATNGINGGVNALLASHDGSVWASADNGVYRFFNQLSWLNNADEGLAGDSVLCVTEDAAGRIWAGTTHGPSVYDPKADVDPPQTSLVGRSTGDNIFPENSAVTILFNGRDKWKFTPSARLLFTSQIDGQAWSPYQEATSARLPKLSAGDHYFQVRCMDRNGNIDQKITPYAFTIELPWYKEARLLLISTAGSVIILLLAALAINRHLRLMRSHAEVEAQVALRTRQLEIANQELLHSQKMNALGTLAAGIAHDFNSILSIIKGSAQIIEDNLDNPEKIRTRANRINTVVEQGAGIVKAMLGFSRGSGGERVMCDINLVVGETVKLLGDRFLREVEVRFEPAPSLPKVPASPDFIQQILLNLIFNAAEAMTDHRQLILRARESTQLPAALVLAPPHVAEYVFITIQDFGSGIDPAILPRIFEPFFTTKSLSARRGTGLGLSMVYELARQMEAGLAVESVLGQGSQFTLILPVRDLPVDDDAKKV